MTPHPSQEKTLWVDISELQTHPNLHSPVWVGSNGGRPQREGTNLVVCLFPYGRSLPPVQKRDARHKFQCNTMRAHTALTTHLSKGVEAHPLIKGVDCPNHLFHSVIWAPPP